MDAGSVCGTTSCSQTAHWHSAGAEVREGEGEGDERQITSIFINVCRHLEMLSAAIAMIVHRFSDSILACKCEYQDTHCS